MPATKWDASKSRNSSIRRGRQQQYGSLKQKRSPAIVRMPATVGMSGTEEDASNSYRDASNSYRNASNSYRDASSGRNISIS
jgi:hypothetical protein